MTYLGREPVKKAPRKTRPLVEVMELRCYRVKMSLIACFMTWPATVEIDLVRGISLGQTSTQFCA